MWQTGAQLEASTDQRARTQLRQGFVRQAENDDEDEDDWGSKQEKTHSLKKPRDPPDLLKGSERARATLSGATGVDLRV
jgi:hypothetical protein